MCLLLKDSHENQMSSVNLGFTVNRKWLGGLAHQFMIFIDYHFTYGGFARMYVYVPHACSTCRH